MSEHDYPECIEDDFDRQNEPERPDERERPDEFSYTVHYDSGTAPVFERFSDRRTAEDRVRVVAANLHRYAVILEDFDE